MSFVDNDDDVLGRVVALRLFGGRGELVDDGEDDPLGALADALGQILAGAGLGQRVAAFLAGDVGTEGPARQERLGQLLLQVHPVGDHDDPAVLQGVAEQQGPAQVDHGEGLAGTGGVPEDAAFALAAGFELGDPLQQGFDAEGLRVPGGNFADLPVKQDEQAQKFQEPVPVEQADQEPILFCGHDRL